MSSGALQNRRTFLRHAGLGILVVAAPACLPTAAARSATAAGAGGAWSDPGTWGGSVPDAGTDVVVDRPVRIDRNIAVRSLRVTSSGVLTLDPGANIEVRSTGNVVVEGRLVSRPVRGVRHRLVFADVNENAYRGGGMNVLESDVGLWVMGAGVLELAGAERRGWARAAGTVAAGARELTLTEDPIGWEVGDEVVLTPTASPAVRDHHTKYDAAQVTRISGRTIGLSRPTANAHPAVDVGRGTTVTAEVLNLTRNVQIEGTQAGRAHVFIRSSSAQELRWVGLRDLGPRQRDAGATSSVMGRYGLHFHMNGAGSRGSIVEGVAATRIGGHAFVPHNSDGITFRDCVSHDTFDDAYWWDGPMDARTPAMPSHDNLWERCVASLVRCDPPFRGYRISGFSLGRGDRNVIRDCVAVGVQGTRDAAGIQWPEGSEGVWGFEGNTAHNNACNGIFTWQNTSKAHVVGGFIGYHNGAAGISHGAYQNAYRYERCTLYGNKLAGVQLHANAMRPNLRFVDLVCDGAGLADFGVQILKHRLAGVATTEFVRCSFRGHREAAFGVVHGAGSNVQERLDLVHCSSEGGFLYVDNTIPASSLIRIQDARHGALAVRRSDQPGTLRAEWNARITPIAPFSTYLPTA